MLEQADGGPDVGPGAASKTSTGKGTGSGAGPSARFRATAAGLAVNVVLSWAALPFVLPGSRTATLRDFGEVVLWQTIGLIGWPLAILGGVLRLFFQSSAAGLWPQLLVLMYPAMLVLFVYVLRAKTLAFRALIALHLVITASFAAVWYQVLNDYDFMVG